MDHEITLFCAVKLYVSRHWKIMKATLPVLVSFVALKHHGWFQWLTITIPERSDIPEQKLLIQTVDDL